jgi:hypothetical protein
LSQEASRFVQKPELPRSRSHSFLLELDLGQTCTSHFQSTGIDGP